MSYFNADQDADARDRARVRRENERERDNVTERFHELLEDENPHHPWAIRHRELQEQRRCLEDLRAEEPSVDAMRKDPRSAATP